MGTGNPGYAAQRVVAAGALGVQLQKYLSASNNHKQGELKNAVKVILVGIPVSIFWLSFSVNS